MIYQVKMTDEADEDLKNFNIVYRLTRTETAMKIIVIAARADEEACKIAERRANQ